MTIGRNRFIIERKEKTKENSCHAAENGGTVQNKLHLYTGSGQGKTTAAMGLALRMLGSGRRVLITQFLKDGGSGEVKALSALENCLLLLPETSGKFTYEMSAAEIEREKQRYAEQVQRLLALLKEEKPAMVVLDELGTACTLGMVSKVDAKRLVQASLEACETVVTGGQSPQWLKDDADYWTEMTLHRHPYEKEGLQARQGIEY